MNCSSMRSMSAAAKLSSRYPTDESAQDVVPDLADGFGYAAGKPADLAT